MILYKNRPNVFVSGFSGLRRKAFGQSVKRIFCEKGRILLGQSSPERIVRLQDLPLRLKRRYFREQGSHGAVFRAASPESFGIRSDFSGESIPRLCQIVNKPCSRNADHNIYDVCDKRKIARKQIAYQIEIENSDGKPVQCADYCQQ